MDPRWRGPAGNPGRLQGAQPADGNGGEGDGGEGDGGTRRPGVGPSENGAGAEGHEPVEDPARDVAAAEPAVEDERCAQAVVAAEPGVADDKSTNNPRDDAGKTPQGVCCAGRECSNGCGEAGVAQTAAENQPAMETAASDTRESDHRADASVESVGGWAQAEASVNADVTGQLWPAHNTAGSVLQRVQTAETDEAIHAAAGQESEMPSNAVAASEVLQLY